MTYLHKTNKLLRSIQRSKLFTRNKKGITWRTRKDKRSTRRKRMTSTSIYSYRKMSHRMKLKIFKLATKQHQIKTKSKLINKIKPNNNQRPRKNLSQMLQWIHSNQKYLKSATKLWVQFQQNLKVPALERRNLPNKWSSPKFSMMINWTRKIKL